MASSRLLCGLCELCGEFFLFVLLEPADAMGLVGGF